MHMSNRILWNQRKIKTSPIFSPPDGEASWLPLPSLVSFLSSDTSATHLFLYPQGDRSGLRKPKKGYYSRLIAVTSSVHLPKSVSTDPTIQN